MLMYILLWFGNFRSLTFTVGSILPVARAAAFTYRLSGMVRHPRNLIKSGTYLLSVSAAFALACILTGCNDISKQKSLASAAAQRFRALYNTDSCQQLYDDASHYFQSHETRPRWLRDCAELRTRFGPWSDFTPASNNSYLFGTVGNVWVRGPAHFHNGEADVRLDWDLTTDHPALSNFLIEAAGEQVSIPGFTGDIRR
jgi:hypothetical protein